MSYLSQLSKQQLAWLTATLIAAGGIIGIGWAIEGEGEGVRRMKISVWTVVFGLACF